MTIKKTRLLTILRRKIKMPDEVLQPGFKKIVYIAAGRDPSTDAIWYKRHNLEVMDENSISLTNPNKIKDGRSVVEIYTTDKINHIYEMIDRNNRPFEIYWEKSGKERI